jgi:LysM repeat protein
MKLKFIYTFLFTMTISLSSISQTISVETAAYINQFKNIAMQEQIRTGVPAAIKLGQAILESQSGKSKLASASNNHFGIKCKTEWTGPKTYHNDDATGECFRVYDNAEASFIDHSNFLKTRIHYAFLFKLDVTDFSSWAFGLKQAGYATNPNYPSILIKIINDYELAQYTLIAKEQKKKGLDSPVEAALDTKKSDSVSQTEKVNPISPVLQSEPFKEVIATPISLLENTKVTINHTRAVVATKGSSLLAIASNNKISLGKIFEYNELPEMNILDQDRILFIEKKQKYGASEVHAVTGTETLYSIAQKEGVQLSTLLTLNPSITKDNILQVGQKIKLRTEKITKPTVKKNKKGKKK